MDVRRLTNFEPRECAGCGQTVSHVELECVGGEKDGERHFLPAKTHKAKCGLWCAMAADAVRPTRDTHGYEGHCRKCNPKPPT
jgi:hypothetical protein